MNLLDTSVWLALALSKHPFHAAADTWFSRQSAAGSVLFCRSTAISLLRLLTTDAVVRPYHLPALTNDDAWDIYQRFRSDKRIAFADDPDGLDAAWKRLALRPLASPKIWMDAYLAAFSIAGGHTCVTTDAGFRQFKGLDVLILS